MNIGFIGTGNMGSGMAANILKAGYRMTVNDLRKESVKPLLDAGASWAGTPKDVAEASDIVFTSLPGPKEVEAVALGKDGIIEGIKPGAVYIDLSTNSPALMRRIYSIFKEKGIEVMDSPVSGGVSGARTGKLALMVGGDEEVFQRCKPVMDAMGDRVSYNGPIGNGSICKLMHNCIGFGIHAVMVECFTAGMKAGIDPRALWQTVKDGAVGRGSFIAHLSETYLKGAFEPASFALLLGFKDVDLAVSVGREFGVPMPLANIVHQDLKAAIDKGWGDKDASVGMLIQEERAGGIEFRIPDAETG